MLSRKNKTNFSKTDEKKGEGSSMKKKLQWPNFTDADKVAEWMDKADFSDYLEPSDLKPLNLAQLIAKSKPKTKAITIRIPEQWLLQAKALAAQMDMPYQTLMKQILRKGLQIKS